MQVHELVQQRVAQRLVIQRREVQAADEQRGRPSGALMGLFLFADLRRRDAWLSLRHWA